MRMEKVFFWSREKERKKDEREGVFSRVKKKIFLFGRKRKRKDVFLGARAGAAKQEQLKQ